MSSQALECQAETSALGWSGGSHRRLLSKDELREAYDDGVGEGLRKQGDL